MLVALEILGYVSRHLHPPDLGALIGALVGKDDAVRTGLERVRSIDWPEPLLSLAKPVESAAENVCLAFDGLRGSSDDPNGAFQAYRAMRNRTRAVEALYPTARSLLPVSRFFLEPDARDDPVLADRLATSDPSRGDVGVMHAGGERAARGGYSMYVPEYYRGDSAMPFIMALHGGSGNGADFLWTWVAEARSRGAILISPTARGDTWSLMGPDIDSENLDRIVEHVAGRWSVDRARMLLTGMSDGGTFTYFSGLRDDSPFTHLAPSSASFHPMLLEGFSVERLTGLPIYLMHGVLDWMFPVQVARTDNRGLRAAGAAVEYREIEDLSHTYPRDENPRVMDWFLGDR